MKVLRVLWQLPQFLLGKLLIWIYSAEKVDTIESATVYESADFMSGISLGPIIILKKDGLKNRNTVMHEYGHCIQSLIFGPLYLIIIGLPSIIQNIIGLILYKVFNSVKYAQNYYNRYPENWADKLGNVKRTK